MATWSAGLEVLIRDRSLVHIGLFLTALIDATGLPFPGRALLVAAGATMATGWGDGPTLHPGAAAGAPLAAPGAPVATGWSDVLTMTLAAALGATSGDHVWYAAGRLGAGDRTTALSRRLSPAPRGRAA